MKTEELFGHAASVIVGNGIFNEVIRVLCLRKANVDIFCSIKS